MNNEGNLDDKGLESISDYRQTGGERYAKAEMNTLDPGQLGAMRETPRDEIGGVAQDGADRVSRVEDRIRSEAKRYERVEMQDLREAGRDEIDRVAQEGAHRIRTAEERYEKAGIEDLRNAARDEIGRVANDGTDPNRSEVERVERVGKNDLRDAASFEIDRVEGDVARTIAEGERDINRAERAAYNDRRETQPGM